MTYKTEQEKFWAGNFGMDYIDRNKGEEWVASNIALFSKILERTRSVSSVLELGANIGLNLQAIHSLLPNASITAVEINKEAVKELRNFDYINARHSSILDFKPSGKWDLAFTKGVLIHLNPDVLPETYDLLYKASRRYILVCEYYNPSPVEITYRGHSGRLFKRDFAGEILERHGDLTLVDYGFSYHRDPNFPQGDISWFLMEKS
ncbi:MAG TPA: pseudaminic acid biosynthesis-associated methylase [Lentisphaeria bacterium]|nr:MAG: pseudaminic acid biosynthesis-associated methylase [Lentisphaerae bacterium GWF2_49_21]HBC87166.1 pseudaminic acid biosynthesis-associated methylase [Lentisphaeria bacterium]